MASIKLTVTAERPIRERQAVRFEREGQLAFPWAAGATVLDAKSGSQLWTRHLSAPVKAVAWGVDGRSLLLLGSERRGSTKGFVRRWPVARD